MRMIRLSRVISNVVDQDIHLAEAFKKLLYDGSSALNVVMFNLYGDVCCWLGDNFLG